MSSTPRSLRLILMAVFFVVVPRAFTPAPVITAISAPQVVAKGQRGDRAIATDYGSATGMMALIVG